MRVFSRSVLCVLLLFSVGPLAHMQEVPQFRGGIDLIPIDVTVLDDKRQAVRGLVASDFTVLENGVARPVRAFTPVELATRVRATEAAWSSEVPPDVSTNIGTDKEGRLVIILMDRSIPPQEPTLFARRIAKTAVDSLGPNDLAAVVSTNNGSVHDSTIQNFTSDRTRLIGAINAQNPSTGISLEAQAIWEKMGPGFYDKRQDGSCLCGLCVLETMTRVADAVRDTPRRRKLLLFIGSDIIWQSMRPTAERGQDTGCETPLEDARKALFASVDRANLTVHSIDPQGLISVGPQTRASTPNIEDLAARPAQVARRDAQQKEMNDVLKGQQSLRQLPDRTGGRTITGRNDAETAIPDIFRESEAYYLLGIERDASARPDTPRSIEVKVARKGVRVQAQRQYIPSGGSRSNPPAATNFASAITVNALTRLLPSADLPLTMSAIPSAPSSQDESKATVRINVDAAAFSRSATSDVALDVVVVATDRTGQPVASARQRSTVAAGGFAADAAEVNIPSHLELPPGDYGIRVAIEDSTKGRVASVFSDLTVPRFIDDPLTLSGVNIDVAADSTATPRPTTRRSFRRTDQVRAQLQIYQGTRRTEPIDTVSMRVQIVDAKGVAVRDQTLPFNEQTFKDRRADCLITLPLARLAPGEYLLKLDATRGRHTSGRALRFVVE
jgi:VWFA-related protein